MPSAARLSAMPIITFPTDRIVGSLDFLGAWDLESGPVLATGSVVVPNDRPVSFDAHWISTVERGGDGWSLSHHGDPLDLDFLADLPPDAIEALHLYSPLVPESVHAVARLEPGLRKLYLANTGLDDAALSHVARLTGLTYLQAWGNEFSDVGVQQLAALTELESLYLEEETLTVAALAFVDRLPRLKHLGLQDMPITEAELAAVQARLPGARVGT
jgi:hypothetical protein